MTSAPRGPRAPTRDWLLARGHLLILAVLLSLSLFLRLYGINWDQGGLYHPDERAILFRVTEIAFPIHDLGSLFTADSVLNPGWFPYGSLPLYLLKLTGYLAPPWLENPGLHQLAVMGRAISALFDVATVLLVYIVGRRLFGRWAGLLGASLVALSALHIQQSHFFITDIMLASLLMASFYFLARAAEDGSRRAFLWAGLLFGLGLATKFSSAPFALVFVAAAALYVFRPAAEDDSDGLGRRERVRQTVVSLVLAAGVTVVTYAIAQPYGLIDARTYWVDVGEQSEMVRRIRDFPFTRQYIDTTPYLYHVKQIAVWGMGLPAGILLWAGVVFGAAMALVRRDRKYILLCSWVLPYLAITGYFDVKFMRYMLPITPFMALMAGGMVSWGVGHLRERRWRLAPPGIAYAGLALVLVFTVFYALSYANIYSKPHPAESAARWINANVPPGSTLLQDSGWEEGFKGLGRYNQFRMEVYDEDTPQKRSRMIESLAKADYLLYYSNRQYGTVARLPERYPMTRGFYEKLFGGELGYELAHWESSYPSLYGVSFADDTFGRPDLPVPEPLRGYTQTGLSVNLGYADESFTVYDHPLILVFRNTLNLSEPQQQQFFDRQLPPPRQVSAVSGRLLLSPEKLRAQRAGGTWSNIFDRDSLMNTAPAFFWILMVQVAFVLTLPITLTVFKRLPDRGYLLGKMLAVLLIAYIPWLLASLEWASFSRASIGAGLVILGVISAALFWLHRKQMVAFIKENRRMVLTGEALFLLSFLGLYAIRLWNPDLWHPFRGGEKPMDFAYFNAVVRSTYMPPYDPWFSGGYLNYYYFGHFMNAVPTKFLGIVPSKAINLAVPLFFALTAAASFSVAYNLAALAQRRTRDGISRVRRLMPSPVLAGLIGAAFVALLGNLDGIVQLSQGVGRVVSGGELGAFDFWRSSRLMPPDPPGFEITEFPFFTFLFADPHAHLFVIPLTLLSLGLALAVIVGGGRPFPFLGRTAVLPLAFLGLTLGAILVTNSWDVLTYAVVAAAAVVIAEYAARRRLDLVFLKWSVVKVAALGLLSVLFFAPYMLEYEVPIREGVSSGVLSRVPLLGTVADTFDNTFKRSETLTVLYQYMGIHGVFIVTLFSYTAFQAWRQWAPRLRSRRRAGDRPGHVPFLAATGEGVAIQGGSAIAWGWIGYAAAGVIALAVLAATGYATIGFLTAFVLLTAPLALREVQAKNRRSPLTLLVYVMSAVALLLGVLVDLFTFENDISRLNTVFKFYLQAWVLFALVSAFALWRLRFGMVFRPKWFRIGWQTFMVLLIGAALIYPVMATPVRARDRFVALPPSRDGMTFMEQTSYQDKDQWLELKWDRRGIEWLQDNVEGSPVIIEGLTPLYRWGNRVSIYTGLPAVIGWDHHQRQQRGDYVGRPSGVDQRRAEVDSFFDSASIDFARGVIDRYDVRYIYVGQLEKAYYSPPGLAKFDTMLGQGLDLAYENEQVRIYRVTAGV